MKTNILRVKIAFVVTLFCLMLAIDVQAYDKFSAIGDILVTVLPVTSLGMIIGHKDGEGFWQYAKSEILSNSVYTALKVSVVKTRPNGDGHSFPSGHTSNAFTSAEFLRKRYGWKFGLPAYVCATVIGYSRVESKYHDSIDVLGGAVIGIASGYLFTQPYKGWDVKATGDNGNFGIRMSYNW